MPACIPPRPSRAHAALLVALVLAAPGLGACAARATTPAAGPVAFEAPRTIVAENAGGDWVDVYMVHELGEWHLGRLAPGARQSLRVPALPERGSRLVRLVAIAGGARTAQPSRDPRAVATGAQPVGDVLERRWRFAERQLTGMRTR